MIAVRRASTTALLERWEREERAPADRIRRFVEILVTNRSAIERYGCPVGTLATELAKLGHDARRDANGLFSLFRDWLRRQFELLGRDADADALAMHLLARSQGVATLASAFREEAFIRCEVEQMNDWLRSVLREESAEG